jgi:hypothetical protein
LSDVRSAPEQPAPPRFRESEPETALALHRAHLAQQRGGTDEAERILQDVLAREPHNVPALGMLSELLRARGDLVGAVAAAQQATDAAADGTAPPGAVARARQERAQIEDHVVRELIGPDARKGSSPLGMLVTPGARRWRSRQLYVALGGLGLAGLFLAIAAVLRGQLGGYLWLGVSLSAAGWTYSDAEARRLGGLFWGPLVLCLGPFGLAIYLLATHY